MKKFTLVFSAFLPILAFAQTAVPTSGIKVVNDFVNKISHFILTPLIFLMFALATLVFIWGIQVFVGAADDAEARSKGARQMIWGILGMVVMLAAVALKTIIENTALKL